MLPRSSSAGSSSSPNTLRRRQPALQMLAHAGQTLERREDRQHGRNGTTRSCRPSCAVARTIERDLVDDETHRDGLKNCTSGSLSAAAIRSFMRSWRNRAAAGRSSRS